MRIFKLLLEQTTQLGGFMFYCIVLGLLALLGEIGMVFALALSLVACMLLTVLIRTFYFKHRPKRMKHSNFLQRLDASSFPSLHSMRALSLAFWLSLHFKSLEIAVYLVAVSLLVMVSRLSLRKHDVSDVFWGMALSMGVNMLIWWLI